MIKLTFSNDKKTITHHTDNYINNNGVICFYKKGIHTLDNYTCIKERYLINIEEIKK